MDMKKELGSSGIYVSKICFGSLTMTPFQSNLSIEEGANLIEYAFERGINFLDTAELYDNYEYIKRALKSIKRDEYIITTKSYAYDKATAEKSLEKALRELGTNYIDIFLLHEQESVHTIRGHYEAIEYFIRQKEKGYIRAIGISTHKVAGAKGFNKYPELDILHPLINYKGLGILDGSRDDMIEQIKIASKNKKGIYAMKILGGGHLIPDVTEAISFINNLDCIDSIAIGMQSREEVDCNISLVERGLYPEYLVDRLREKKRKLIVADYCTGCSICVNKCRLGGIEIKNGQASATEKCILCGYCANYCPDFCIKVI
ncbi:MAG: aldo/keto reductase [Tissierellia bacterium]|nr:aldo/keto reductase [Tissierellia bacterium]